MSTELDYNEHYLKKHLHLVLAKEDIDLTGKYYSIVKSTTVKERGEDHNGRYKICESSTYLHQYETEQEYEQNMRGMAESIDDVTDYDVIKSGEIPERLRNTQKRVAQKL